MEPRRLLIARSLRRLAADQVFITLPGPDDPPGTTLDEHFRRPRPGIVLRSHRHPVRAGGPQDDQVPGRERGQAAALRQHVGALADRPHHVHHLAPRTRTPHRLDLVVRLVERRRSEEHTSELQSPCNLVCRLLLEKKKKKTTKNTATNKHTNCN